MKRFKKLSVVIVALAMCALLGISVWAANSSDVTYTATFDKPTLCMTGEEQTVTLTINISEKVLMDSFTAQVKVPEGLTLTKIENSDLSFTEGDNFNLANGMIAWYATGEEAVHNDLLAKITITVPANTSMGTYNIEFEIIDISSDHGTPWETDETLTATLTVAEHSWGEPSYTNTEGDTHTANYVCGNDASHKNSKTVEHDFAKGNCVCGKAAPVATGLKGDVDLDEDVDIDDFVLLARHIGDVSYINGVTALNNADVNDDGVINIDDFVYHAQYLAGVITDWPKS